MKLSQYAQQHSISYRAAWNRYKAGKIEGAWQDESGTIIVPEHSTIATNKAAVYARVSDPSKRATQLISQQQRVEQWAIANGYEIVHSVAEVGSEVNDKRRKLSKLLTQDDWSTLIVEHKDRLTRFGFAWFELLLQQQHKQIIVINQTGDEVNDLVQDFIAIIYSFSARLYGKRRRNNPKQLANQILEANHERA